MIKTNIFRILNDINKKHQKKQYKVTFKSRFLKRSRIRIKELYIAFFDAFY